MSCLEFERTGYLFLSGELTSAERAAYERHLHACAQCREALEEMKEIWGLMEQLPQVNPSVDMRTSILKEAKRKKVREPFFERVFKWIARWTSPRGLAWGLSTAVVAVIVLIVFIHPFDQIQNGRRPMEEILAWDDDFMSQVDWMDREIDRVESGALLTNYTFGQDVAPQSEDWLSPMSDDIGWFRDKVEDLVKTIYGI